MVFLRLLEASAESISRKQNLERKLHFGVIVSLLLREEFRYNTLVANLEKNQYDVLAGYTHQLNICTRETIDCLQNVNEYSDAATINSCMKILAIAFIRLPIFRNFYQKRLDDELNALRNYPEEESQSLSTSRVLDACEKYEKVAEITSKDPFKRRLFAKENADVFGWNSVDQIMRACPQADLKRQFLGDVTEIEERLNEDSSKSAQTFQVALRSNEGFYYFFTNYLKVRV